MFHIYIILTINFLYYNLIVTTRDGVYVWIHVHVSSFFFYFLFFSCVFCLLRQLSLIMHCSSTIHALQQHYSRTIAILFTHCSWDPQPLYSEKNIKNGSHNIIYTFKNYFATVFSVFSFNKNKLYPNGPGVFEY